MTYQIGRNHCEQWDLYPDLLISTLMLLCPFWYDSSNTEMLPQISPSVDYHGTWGSHFWCSFLRGHAEVTGQGDVTERKRGYLSSTARSWNRVVSREVPGFRIQDEMGGRKQKKPVRRRWGRREELGKGLVITKHLYCTYASTKNPPQDNPVR